MFDASVLAHALLLGSPGPQTPAPASPPPTAAVEPADEFKASLALVQQLVQSGTFERAGETLTELLGRHERATYARLRAAEIVELAKRCAFRRAHPDPKLADLVSGELVRYEPRNGELEIRYVPSGAKDLVRTSSEIGSLLQHPALFVDMLTVEVDCPADITVSGQGPSLLIGIDTDETFLVCFGTSSDPKYGGIGHTYVPPQILRVKHGSTEIVDRHQKPAAPYDKKFKLKVVVGSFSVTAYRDGKRLLQAKRSVRESGRIALVSLGEFERLSLKGRIQPSWPQGLYDAATQEALATFEKKWKPEKELPAWLFEAVAAPTPALADSTGSVNAEATGAANALRAALGSFKTRREQVDALTGKRPMAELEVEWRKLVDAYPREPAAWINLALVQLRLGRTDAAQATCDAARAAGIAAADLAPVPRMLLQSRTGPEWTRVFTYESAHYVVKSDIDQAVCIEASKVLEESYRSYLFRLAPVADTEKRKFSVFLFSGKAGYLDYARDTLFAAPASTAGLYSPLLKQLLIWNLPDRDSMYLTVRHEGFHQYFDRVAEAPPIWLNEGLAEYYELADLYGGQWKEGQVNADHVELLTDSDTKWVPLRTLLDMETPAFQSGPVGKHYAQSWALVHYLKRGPMHVQAMFRKFWNAVIAGKPREQATQEAFGDADLAAFEEGLRSHVRKLAEQLPGSK